MLKTQMNVPIARAASVLNLHNDELAQLAKENKIPSRHLVGTFFFFAEEDLLKYKQENPTTIMNVPIDRAASMLNLHDDELIQLAKDNKITSYQLVENFYLFAEEDLLRYKQENPRSLYEKLGLREGV